MNIDQQTLTVLVLIGAGTVLMFASLLRLRGVLHQTTDTGNRKWWQGTTAILGLFTVGYTITAAVLLSDVSGVFEFLVGGVYFAGALFVLSVVETSRKTVAELDDKRTSLQERTEEVEQLQADLSEQRTHIHRKANDYQIVMQACRDGDLTQRMNPESQNQAMTEIAEEFNEMIATVEDTVDDLKRFASEVATFSQEITLSTEEVQSESEYVAESMEEISSKADRQNANLQQASEEMNTLLSTIGEIAASSDEVVKIAEQTAETGREGRQAAQDAIEGMGEIEDEAAETVKEIEQLEEQVQQIDELTDFISEIAEQTNMLALNANIEANRGGEGGGGFAVVANEVKQLAAGTKQAAGDIEERLERIQAETTETVEEVRITSDRIADHTESVENAVNALDEIANFAEKTNRGIRAIDQATDRQAESTEEVVDIVDEAAAIGQETTTAAVSLAEETTGQTAALRQVTKGTDLLATQAQQLSTTLDRFEVDTADTGTSPPASVDKAADGDEFASFEAAFESGGEIDESDGAPGEEPDLPEQDLADLSGEGGR